MKKLTRTEANFENLIESAILLEGHCRHAEHGCSCRGCDECEENYRIEQEGGEAELTLAELIDRELGPDVSDRYEYEGEDPYEEYDEDAEEQDLSKNPLALAAGLLGINPPDNKNPILKQARDAADGYVKRIIKTFQPK